MPTFNANAFLKDNGLTLVDAGSKEGEAIVQDQSGNQRPIDFNKELAKDGVKVAPNTDFVFNSPDTPIDRSPVSIIDRLKLSFGNPQGQMAFLKSKYGDKSVLDDNGNLKVKEHGVWYNLDPKGLGSGDGWDIAHGLRELAGDAADLGGDVLVGAGQAIGATLGAGGAAAEGAAAGGATGTVLLPGVGTGLGAAAGAIASAIPGGIAGSAAGAATASTAKAVLGRYLGTYQATPAEMAKDVALDGILGAAGETIAIGAKHTILPAAKAAFTKISETAEPAVKNMIASVAKSFGASEVGAYRLANSAPEVMQAVDSGIAAAGKSPTNDVIQQSLAKQEVNSLKPLIEGAQQRLSKAYQSDQAAVIASVPDNHPIDLSKASKASVDGLMSLGVLDPHPAADGTVRFVAKSPKEIAESLGIGGTNEAKIIGGKIAQLANDAAGIFSRYGDQTGKEAAASGLDMVRQLRQIKSIIPESNQLLSKNISEAVDMISANVRSTLPREAQALATTMDANYATRIGYVEKAEKAVAKLGDQGLEQMVNQLRKGDGGSLGEFLGVMTDLHPQGEFIKDNAMNAIAARDFVNWIPKKALGFNIGSGVAAVAGAGAAKAVGAPLALAGAAIASPRIYGRGVSAATKAATAGADALRFLSPTARAEALTDRHFMGPILSSFMNPDQGNQ